MWLKSWPHPELGASKLPTVKRDSAIYPLSLLPSLKATSQIMQQTKPLLLAPLTHTYMQMGWVYSALPPYSVLVEDCQGLCPQCAFE